MKKRLLVILIGCVGILVLGFRRDGGTQVKVPPGFPRPVYTFKGNRYTVQKFQMGRMLFYDPILSADSTITCESCHQRVAAFGHIDHVLSHGINGQIGTRNVPGLQNMIWGRTFMWDGRVTMLERQSVNPITSPIEMNEQMANVVAKLQRSARYAPLFREAFGKAEITEDMVLKSITQFVASLVSANSRYDRYMAGTDTFSEKERSGLALFRQHCAACHPEPLFTDNSYHNNGLQPDTTLRDKGRAGVTGDAVDVYKFKVPSLRNVEMTYPYMHDGRYRRLRDVLNHYSNKANQTSLADAAVRNMPALTDKEKVDITAFLLTLTDREFLTDARFSDPFVR